jgi:hypothetical protein
MLKAKINDEEYQILTRWEEVDPVKLSDCVDFRAELACLTTVPIELLNRATELQLFPLYTVISFIHEVELLPALQALNVEKASYEKMEISKQELSTNHKPYRKILNVAMMYYPEEKNPVRLIGLGLNIISQIALFLENYEDMLHSEPEPEESSAGIEDLSAFGSWGTAFVLAGKDPLKVNEVLQRPAIEIYTCLYFTWKESKYQKALIKSRIKDK